MREFIRDRFPEFAPTARADESLSAAQLAERRMAERDALLAKLGSGALGDDLPQIEFVKQNIVDKALSGRPDARPALGAAAAAVDEPAIWFEVSEQERDRAKKAKEQAALLKRIAEQEADLARRDAAEQELAELQLAQLRAQQSQRQLDQPPQAPQPPVPQAPAPPRAAFKQPLSRSQRAAAASEVDDDEEEVEEAAQPVRSASRKPPAAALTDAVVRLIESGDIGKLSLALGAVSLAVGVAVLLLVFVWRVVLAETVLFPVLLLVTLALVALLASQFAAHRQGAAEQRYVVESLLALRVAAAIAALLFVRSLRRYALFAAAALAVGLFVHAQRPPRQATLALGADPAIFGAVVAALVALVFELVAGGGSGDAVPVPVPVAPKAVESPPSTPAQRATPVKSEPAQSPANSGLKKRNVAGSPQVKADDEDAQEAQTAAADAKKHK